jgi:hypothetical protein
MAHLLKMHNILIQMQIKIPEMVFSVANQALLRKWKTDFF